MFTRLESNPVLGFLTGFLTGFLYLNGCTITVQPMGDAMDLAGVILDDLALEANKKITGLNPVLTTDSQQEDQACNTDRPQFS